MSRSPDQASSTPVYRGRFAPSPTGPLHLGSLTAALGSWLFARRAGGVWLVRIEDIDPPREVPGAVESQLRALTAFGLIPDEPPLRQSRRREVYRDALERLIRDELVFPCACSRQDLADAHGIHRRCLRPAEETGAAWRLRVPENTEVEFVDRTQGRFRQRLDREVGDFVLIRRDGLFAYQLAVVVDDHAQGIVEVVRGADLLDSTPRQIFLQRMLGLASPAYAHLPVVRDAEGHKLGKSLAALPIDPTNPMPALREAWRRLGQNPAAMLGSSRPEAALLRALPAFEPERIPVETTFAPGIRPVANAGEPGGDGLDQGPDPVSTLPNNQQLGRQTA